jgi:hypothetical protein
MKNITRFLNRPTLRGLIIGLAALALSSQIAKATPYASGCTNYTGDQNGDIGFFINESGTVNNPQTVTVIYDDGSTNANFNGITTGLNVPRGSNYFNLAGHNGYQIRVFKVGSGAPSKISVDTDSNSIWANPGGLAVNQNPKIGPEFGRIYVGSRGTGGYGWGVKGFHNYGIYALNADFTTALGQGTNSYGYAFYSLSGGSGPWRMRVAAPGTGLDNQLLVADFSGNNASVLAWTPDLTSYQPLLKGVGQAAGLAAQTHSDSLFGTPVLVGSLAAGNLKLWVTEADWACPGNLAEYGPNTGIGMYNLLLRFDIGPGPIPPDGWPGPPNYAYTVGLEGIANLRPEVDIGKDGKIFAGFGRGNLSNPNLQVLDPTGQTFLYFGGVAPPYYNQNTTLASTTDPWNGWLGSAAQVGTYAGVRVSPDGKYVAAVDLNSGITVASLTRGNADPNLNGLPDETTIFNVPNTTYAATARGMDWDAANNIYICSSGQLLTRAYSLGGTTTCVTSNDWTGTNGTFSVALPPVIATLNVTQPYASQNYGTPIPGVARITINTNALSAPFTVYFTRGGTALYANPSQAMYSINTNSSPWAPFGVKILTNSVIFPVGTNICGVGANFYVDVLITPTTFPVSTNTQTVILGLANPSAYQFGTPSKGTVYLQNTGPQLLVLTAAAGGASMYRGVTNDYAKFVITRFGDTNGPGNSAGNVSQIPYTVTNLSYYGTAKYPDDYRARAQRADPAADGKIQTPVDGPTAIVIYPGDTAVTCIVGNPVMHTNFNYTPTNLTIIFNLTNAVTCGVGGACTNGIPTPEGFTYNVRAATVTLTEIDNAVGPEVVLWSDTMTNAANSVNYTLTFAGTNFGAGAMPVVVPNYINNQTSIYGTGMDATNDFLVNFGSDIATNVVPVPPSPVMLASNWPQKALKMTVNKALSTICGVNVFPAAQQFGGNYALRFNMFLSLWSQYINDPYISQNFREYALFGVNHYGTNCMWRPSTTMIAGTGMIPTNSDGQWFAIDAGYHGITPADYELYVPGPLPNDANANGSGLRGIVSWSATSPVTQGYFKHPPFDTSGVNDATRTVANPGGGQPVNKWVDVSVEITAQTNLTLYINRANWLNNSAVTNGLGWGYAYTNGTIMLGYDDPDRNVSDQSSFVYYSNVRVVELSPYIVLQPSLMGTNVYSLIRTQGASLVLTAAVNYASAPITGVWYRAVATVGNNVGQTLSNPYVQSNWFNATSANLSLALTNVQAANGTNYVLQVRDPAGSVNSAPVALEVVSGPTNAVASIGSTFQWAVRSAGPAVVAPTAYQWKTNSVNLATNLHYNGVNFTNMWITNVQPADAGTYSVLVTSSTNGTVTPTATLTVVSAIAPASQTNLWGSSPSFTEPTVGPTPTYQWRFNNVNIPGANGSALTLPGVVRTNAGNYTVVVTAPNGLSLTNAQGVLTVSVPPPVFTPGGASISGGNMVLPFTSPNNPNDTASSFVLQSCGYVLAAPAVTPFTNNLTAVFSTPSPGQFQVSVPQTGDTMFYRLVHVYP